MEQSYSKPWAVLWFGRTFLYGSMELPDAKFAVYDFRVFGDCKPFNQGVVNVQE